MSKPTCRKCGQPHYNFVKCDAVTEFNDAEHTRRNPREMGQTGFRSETSTVVPLYGRVVYRNDGSHEYDQKTGLWRRRREHAPDVT